MRHFKEKKAAEAFLLPPPGLPLFEFALPRRLRFFLFPDGRFFVMFPFADLLNDSVAGGLLLEPAECAIQRFILFHLNLTHVIPLPSAANTHHKKMRCCLL
jgi:hypothetical protein